MARESLHCRLDTPCFRCRNQPNCEGSWHLSPLGFYVCDTNNRGMANWNRLASQHIGDRVQGVAKVSLNCRQSAM